MKTKQLSTLATIALIFLAGLLYFQLEWDMADPLETAETSPSATEPSKTPEPIPLAPESDPTCMLCDDLDAQLIATQGELQAIQQKLILANSKAQIAEDEMGQMADARSELKSLKGNLHLSNHLLKKVSDDLSAIQDEYKLLAELFIQQNKSAAEQSTQHLAKLTAITRGVSITAALSPLIAIAKLIEYGSEEIKSYCGDIEAIILLEKKAFATNTSLTTEALDQYNKYCQS